MLIAELLLSTTMVCGFAAATWAIMSLSATELPPLFGRSSVVVSCSSLP
jgi:hypothetical protein